MPAGGPGFLLTWEKEDQPKAVFESKRLMPYTWRERDRISRLMTVQQILDTSQFIEEEPERLIRKWKEILHLWDVCRRPEYRRGSLENALWYYGTTGITCHHFTIAVMSEFKFKDSDHMDAHLRWLYWSFDGGKENLADWREVSATCYILIFYKVLRLKPVHFMIKLFDIFAEGGSTGDAVPNDTWYISSHSDLCKIFKTPCYTVDQQEMMCNAVDDLLDHYQIDLHANEPGYDNGGGRVGWLHSVSRRKFKEMLKMDDEHYNPVGKRLMNRYISFAWDRMTTELKLNCFDEIQVDAMRRADEITHKHQMRLALALYGKALRRKVFREWRIAAGKDNFIRKFSIQRFMKKRRGVFRFWRKYTAKRLVLRRTNLLAEVMGCYIMKGRYFARIKLYIYTERKLHLYAAKYDPKFKSFKQAGYHLRTFFKVNSLKKVIVKWWRMVEVQRNEERAEDFLFKLRFTKLLRRWHEWAAITAHNKRNLFLVEDNKRRFDMMMAETEKQAEELVKIEKAKQQEKIEAEAKAKEEEKVKARQAAQDRIRQIKKDEEKTILEVQRDGRRRRVRKQLIALEKGWKKYWSTKADQIIEDGRQRAQEFLENPKESEELMLMRFRKLKKEFFEPPVPENEDREAIITNPANITFLYIESKLNQENTSLKKVVPKFDEGNKGYLTYSEFKKMIKAVGVKLSPIQVNAVIRSVDADGDGYIELEELEEAMKATENMGEPGSVWRLYVDPASDVICYHNFETDVKVMEYDMTDELLHEINIANYYGEALVAAKKRVELLRDQDWEKRQKHYFCKRIQYMYRVWKARKNRAEYGWKVAAHIGKENRVWQRQVIEFIERMWAANHVRAHFRKQYLITIEKIWDAQQGRMFWYNHKTQESSWNEPHLVRRYGDTEAPDPWVVHMRDEWIPAGPVDGQVADPDQGEWKQVTSYWHTTAKIELKRKPDGVFICELCDFNIALRYCNECKQRQCFTCHREMHMHPWEFCQNVKITKKMRVDPKYIGGCAMFKHTWKRVEPFRCEMCKSDKIMAAFDCSGCSKKLCRPCFRRIHEDHPENKLHIFNVI